MLSGAFSGALCVWGTRFAPETRPETRSRASLAESARDSGEARSPTDSPAVPGLRRLRPPRDPRRRLADPGGATSAAGALPKNEGPGAEDASAGAAGTGPVDECCVGTEGSDMKRFPSRTATAAPWRERLGTGWRSRSRVDVAARSDEGCELPGQRARANGHERLVASESPPTQLRHRPQSHWNGRVPAAAADGAPPAPRQRS